MNIRELIGRPVDSLTVEEMHAIVQAEMKGGVFPGELPLEAARDRELSLDRPSYFATEVLDEWYRRHFEPSHYRLLDDVLGPWIQGETVTLDGSTYDPTQYTGLMVLWSRSTVKSTMLRIIALWSALWRKLRVGEDARAMFTHQTYEKAVEHSEAVRQIARCNPKFRASFPEFAKSASGEWDTKSKWRWPNFDSYQATEWSFTCYGGSSSKTGGHYTDRFVDDWVTEDSVTTAAMLDQSWQRFVAMDQLRDRSRPYNPWIAVGTHYHFQDTYRRILDRGGWLCWKLPAFNGSPKRIFDICSIPDGSPAGRKLIAKKVKALETDPPGALNFPKLLPWGELYRTARATGPAEFNTQIMLNPVPEGEQRFDHDALDESWQEEIPAASEMWLYIRVDPAISVKKDADETAMLVGGVRWNGERWFIDGWVGREKRPTEIVRKAFTLARRWIAQGYVVKNIGVESVAYQEALAQIARGGVPEREASYSGESIPMITSPVPIRSITRSPDMRKHQRILQMDGPVTRRELKLWRKIGAPGEKLLTQFKEFPFGKDDCLDAAHDFWAAGVSTPPKALEAPRPVLHPELMKLLLGEQKDQSMLGTHQTVRLANWG